MTPAVLTASSRAAAVDARPVAALARLEIRRYARHPLFLLGLVINVAICLAGPDPKTSVALNGIAPAAATGVLGIVIMASLTRGSETMRSAAGVVATPERTRSLALIAACAVPFVTGLLWWAWALVVYLGNPPSADGFPFGPADDAWTAAVMFGQGPMACLGGPLLGILVGRWTRGRGAPALTAVGVIAAIILMQGLFEPLRRVRVVMPWTHWGGPYGVDGDAERMLVFSGSPYWWVAYVACLCALAVLGILLHDREQSRRPVWRAAAVVGAFAVVTVFLAMWTGLPDTVPNPLRST